MSIGGTRTGVGPWCAGPRQCSIRCGFPCSAGRAFHLNNRGAPLDPEAIAQGYHYALAMSGIRFRNYLIGTLAGLPLPVAVYCLLFDLLASGLRLP